VESDDPRARRANRVTAYAVVMVTDEYPPFQLRP
jgi:hypothetical protein